MEDEEHQDMIDLTLQKYFEVDRHLSRGNIFSIHINWNCNSIFAFPATKKSRKENNNIVYFKVDSVEPSDKPVLCDNRTSTALVLGRTSPSALPPDSLISGPRRLVSILLYGVAGFGKRKVVKYVARKLGLLDSEIFSLLLFHASSLSSYFLLLMQPYYNRCLPTVLLLCHFDVFQNSHPLEDSLNDQEGIISEVASVIRKSTEPDIEDEDICSQGKPNDDLNAGKKSWHRVLLVAAADSSEVIPPTIRCCFSHEINMGPLTEEQRAEMLSQSLQSLFEFVPNTNPESFLKNIVGQASGLLQGTCVL
ncbi:peroxisome biogenesis protein 6 [Quillaja saponaria]|uniref:Peroxisome biogenesis protein 6 n=1 Tax=Quillaja saponaria TaxID=32244 RepID=A0AAD7Q9V7_QUISA|nr:peroxisome biogenesis protein 6 [Quillaja saponaria]